MPGNFANIFNFRRYTEGMNLRRRQSPLRLAKFPRLLAKVKKDAKAAGAYARPLLSSS